MDKDNLLTPQEIQKVIDVINKNPHFSPNQKKALLLDSWRLIYKQKPPTIQEFLTEEWIGEMAESVYPYIKEMLYQIFDARTPYRNLIMSLPIGAGKSTAVALANLYISVIVYLMRNPKKTFGLAASTSICNVFVAFSLDKAKEVLLAPFKEIILSSPKFVQCKTIEQMRKLEKEGDSNKIYWTTAGTASVLSIGSNMSIKIKSSAHALLGLTILCGSLTELAFFKEAGFSDEDIMGMYNEVKGRIFSRFPEKNGLNLSILDSSPNDMTYEASIDYYIWNIAPKDKENLILKGRKWDLQPQNFPIWDKDRTQVFWIAIKTKTSSVPKVIKDKELIKDYDSRDIIECPIDGLTLAENDTIKFLKDYAGYPAGASDRLLTETEVIEDVFRPSLQNIYSHITAPDIEPPEGLIWGKIKDIFFIEIDKKNHVYEFYRNPNEKRYVSVDLSETGDTASVAVSHPELNLDGEIIDVVDMTVPIIPNKGRIGLDSIKFFILDLKRYGRLNIDWVSFDGFQSSSSQEFIKREGFNIEELSVDFPAAPYLNFIQSVKTNRVKSGKNIYLKNNLKSLKMSSTKGGKPKVDHEMGKVENSLDANDNWETSSLGFNAKDVSDSVCATVELRKKHFEGVPRYIYQELSIDNSESKEPILTNLKKHTMKLKKTS